MTDHQWTVLSLGIGGIAALLADAIAERRQRAKDAAAELKRLKERARRAS